MIYGEGLAMTVLLLLSCLEHLLQATRYVGFLGLCSLGSLLKPTLLTNSIHRATLRQTTKATPQGRM